MCRSCDELIVLLTLSKFYGLLKKKKVMSLSSLVHGIALPCEYYGFAVHTTLLWRLWLSGAPPITGKMEPLD